MTTESILSLIDTRLSKAHCDKNEPVAIALNELRERIVAEPGRGSEDDELIDPQQVADEVRERDDKTSRENAAYTIEALIRRADPRAKDHRIQEQAAQLCAVRNAAGMQVGTIEELCQRIEAMRRDADTWRLVSEPKAKS